MTQYLYVILFICIFLFASEVGNYLYFTDLEAEARRDYIICLKTTLFRMQKSTQTCETMRIPWRFRLAKGRWGLLEMAASCRTHQCHPASYNLR